MREKLFNSFSELAALISDSGVIASVLIVIIVSMISTFPKVKKLKVEFNSNGTSRVTCLYLVTQSSKLHRVSQGYTQCNTECLGTQRIIGLYTEFHRVFRYTEYHRVKHSVTQSNLKKTLPKKRDKLCLHRVTQCNPSRKVKHRVSQSYLKHCATLCLHRVTLCNLPRKT